MTNQNPEQELTIKFQMLEQQIMMIQQQLQAVEKAIVDITEINFGLDEIKEGKEILAQIGKGIFIPAKISSNELTVDVGDKKFVKKSIKDTKGLIGGQINKLGEVREQLNSELEKINKEITDVMMAYSKKNK